MSTCISIILTVLGVLGALVIIGGGILTVWAADDHKRGDG